MAKNMDDVNMVSSDEDDDVQVEKPVVQAVRDLKTGAEKKGDARRETLQELSENAMDWSVLRARVEAMRGDVMGRSGAKNRSESGC
ncbi:hypothetical protein OESDEN_03730 [Oesophagostomum dentatum]|uniref:Uncharacterized protein n=1 Tax=Oesophagostomum dentatum TaxID=61180 RepID=A0A0B1TLM2_OESDE|nr:hypothetical protein OESDEN_03730 [Oesophagostomum dentatum]